MAGSKADTMADEIVSIELKLKTNFANELVNASTQLSRFGDRATAISKIAVGSLESLNRQLSTTMRSMSEATLRDASAFVGAMSNQSAILESRNKSFVASNLKSTDSLRKQYDTVMKYLNQVDKVIAEIDRKAKLPTRNEKGEFVRRFSPDDIKQMTNIRDNLKAGIDQFHIMNAAALKKLTVDSIGLIKQNVTTLTTSSVRALEFVGKTADDIFAKIGRGRFAQSGMLNDTAKAMHQAQMLAESKSGLGSLISLHRDQAARLGATGRSRRDMESMLRNVPAPSDKATDAERAAYEKFRLGILEVVTALRKMEEQSRQSLTGMRPHIQALNKEVKVLETEMYKMGKDAALSLKRGIISESAVNDIFGKLMQSFGQQILYATRSTDQAFLDAAKNSRLLQDRITDTITKLKAQGREADILKKTGFMPEDLYARTKESIAQRLEQVQQLREKLLMVAKDFKQLAIPKNFDRMTDLSAMTKSVTTMEEMQRRMMSFGHINMTNFAPAVAAYRGATGSQGALDAQVVKAQRNLTEVTRVANRARELAEKETNEEIKNNYLQLYNILRSEALRMHTDIQKALSKKIDMSGMLASIKQTAQQLQNSMVTGVPSADTIKARFREIHNLYDQFALYQQQVSQKWFVGAGTRAKGSQMYNDIRAQIDAYRQEYERVKELYAQLSKVQSLGMGNKNTAQVLANTKATLDAMRVSMLELGRVNDQAGKKMEMIQEKTIAGAVSSGWNMLRNFRWQTAALGYFVYAAVNNVKRFVLGVFDEIFEFRKQAMSLAASFTYQMLGDLKTNFDTALAYSRNLMVQMQIVAAKTSLSMEDMTNLVRTFAQAGIIPKGTGDLERIAAIGTAIQAVTEGMANQGVQMKQELNALILGRQRATDSLAMMFQFMGVNIKELMQKAREEGANMLEVLSDALKPFNEMMGRMKDEWGAVKNRMELAWEVMKRFALEGFLQDMASGLGKKIGEYFDEKSGELTAKGKQIAQIIRSVYEAGYEILKVTFEILGSILGIFNELLNVTYDWGLALQGASDSSKKFEGNYRGVLELFKEILQVVWLIKHTLAATFAFIKLPIQTIISLVETVQGLGKWAGGLAVSAITGKESKRQQEGVAQMKKAWADVAQASADIWNLPANAKADLDNLEKTFGKVRELTSAAKTDVSALATFKLPVDIKTIGDTIKALEKHFETKGISETTIATLASQIGNYTSSVKGEIKQVEKANGEVEAAIEDAAKKYGISADIIRAVAWKESRYNPKAVSSAGAQGIMQIMPKTGKELGLEDPFDIKQNVDAGAKYLKQMIERFKGDLSLALAAYNAGPGAVDKAGGVPKFAETMEYVRDLTGQTDAIVKTMGADFDALASKGPALFAEQAKNAKEEFFKVEESLLKGVAALKQLFWDADLGLVNLSEDDRKMRSEQLSVFEKMIGKIRVYYALIDAEERAKTDKFNKAEEDKATRLRRHRADLERELSGKPMDRNEKYNDWYDKQVEKLKEFIDLNRITGEAAEALWNKLGEGAAHYWAEVTAKTNVMIEEYKEKLSTHKPKTPFETIRGEFEKLKTEQGKVAKEESLTPEQIADLDKLRTKYEAERIAIEHINQQHDLTIAKLNNQIKLNEYYAGSYSPITQQQAALNALLLNYQKDIEEVKKSIDDIDAKWKDVDGNWRNVEGVEYTKEMRKNYVEALQYMQMSFEREFFKKQHPMWAELIELSKGWADSMTDAIADFVDGTKTMKNAIKDLQKSIQRDVLKAVIKNYITNPIMHVLGSGEPGSPTPAQRVAGQNAPTTGGAVTEAAKQAAKIGSGAMGDLKKTAGTLDAMVAAGRPIPVYIVADPNEVFQDITSNVEKVSGDVVDAVKETTQEVTQTSAEEKSIFSQMLSALLSLHNWMAAGGASGGGGGGFGGLFDSIMGLFGGGEAGGSSMAGMGDASAMVGGYGAGAAAEGSIMDSIIGSGMMYAFADGGTISEQIVGRGLESGSLYTFGERAKYGQNEIVAPADAIANKLSSGGTGTAMNVNMPIHISAIDTQSGVEFLMKNNHVLESNMIKAIRNNRRIRDAMMGR